MVRPKTPQLAGRATVRLKSGATYEGRAACAERVVTVTGRLRVVSSTGVSYRSLRTRTIPLGLVSEILWADDASVA
jgi:hypothetical protein